MFSVIETIIVSQNIDKIRKPDEDSSWHFFYDAYGITESEEYQVQKYKHEQPQRICIAYIWYGRLNWYDKPFELSTIVIG